MEQEIPKYVKAILEWNGTEGRVSKINKVYCTDITPNFSSYNWYEIYNNKIANDKYIFKKYFEIVTKKEWNKQEGLISEDVINEYSIY